jgi:high-affinity iron transporter
MLLTSVIIVLREVLEAALLISILSALSATHGISRRWIVWALACGILSAIGLGHSIDAVSEWFDGVGQEVINAFMQFAIYLFMAIFAFLIRAPAGNGRHHTPVLPVVMALIVALAMTREGSEVLVYLSGFTTSLKQFLVVLLGSAVGAGIGISTGALIYYLLRSMPHRRSQFTSVFLLVLVAAGLTSQAALLLIQADWLPSQLPVWDSSSVIAEDSVSGQLLYALIGYEATPTSIQAGFYFGSAALLLLISVTAGFHYRRPHHGSRGARDQ